MHTSSTLTLMSAQSTSGYILWVVSYLVVSSFKKIGLLIACGYYSRYFAFTYVVFI